MIRLFLFLIVALSQQSFAFDYCSLNCSASVTHTACGNNCGPSSECDGIVKELEMTAEVRQWFLDRHNAYRNQVALGLAIIGNGFTTQAADMHVMEYDEELEYIARCWTNKCIFGHDQCRNTKDFYVGQNGFSLWSSAAGAELRTKDIIEKSVFAWYALQSYYLANIMLY